MADSNTPIGKVRSRLCFYLRSSVSYVAFHVTFHGVVTQESSAFPTLRKTFRKY